MKTDTDGPFPLGYLSGTPPTAFRARDRDATPSAPHSTRPLATRSSPPPGRKSSVPPPPPRPLRVELGAAQARVAELEEALAASRAECASLKPQQGAPTRASFHLRGRLAAMLGAGVIAAGSLLGLAFDAGHVTALSALGALGALFVLRGFKGVE